MVIKSYRQRGVPDTPPPTNVVSYSDPDSHSCGWITSPLLSPYTRGRDSKCQRESTRGRQFCSADLQGMNLSSMRVTPYEQ